MSEQDFFYGYIQKSDHPNILDTEDTDEFYELEAMYGCHFVKYRGEVYEAHPLSEVDPYGFSLVIPPSDQHRVVCSWYNGGAGIHEVLEAVLEQMYG